MDSTELKYRTKNIALRIMRLVDRLPKTMTGNVIAKQILRSATSVGANYRAACRAKSRADFIYKLKIVEEEADETLYWLELIEEGKLLESNLLQDLKKDVNSLVAILVTTIKTARKNS